MCVLALVVQQQRCSMLIPGYIMLDVGDLEKSWKYPKKIEQICARGWHKTQTHGRVWR